VLAVISPVHARERRSPGWNVRSALCAEGGAQAGRRRRVDDRRQTIDDKEVRELARPTKVHPDTPPRKTRSASATRYVLHARGGDIMFVERRFVDCTEPEQRANDADTTQVSGWGNVSLILTVSWAT